MKKRYQPPLWMRVLPIVILVLVTAIVAVALWNAFGPGKTPPASEPVSESQTQTAAPTVDSTAQPESSAQPDTTAQPETAVPTTQPVETTALPAAPEPETAALRFSEEEVKAVLQEYLRLKGALEGSPEGMLVELGLWSFDREAELLPNNYRKTDIPYAEYREKMLQIMTEDWLEGSFQYDGKGLGDSVFKEEDGWLCFYEAGATGGAYELGSLTPREGTEGEYLAEVYSCNEDGSRELWTAELRVAEAEGRCVIAAYQTLAAE